MLSKWSAFLRKPYPLNVEVSKNFVLIAGFSVFVSLFLILFQPLGLDRFQHPHKNLLLIGIGGVCFLVITVQTYLIPRGFRTAFDEERWSVAREIVWQAWLCLSTIQVLALYWALLTGMPFTGRYVLIYTIKSLLFTLFFMPSCVMLNYIRLIRKKLQKAEAISRQLQGREGPWDEGTVELQSETGKEKLKLPAARLLFIQSCDNYANIVQKRNGNVEEVLLRSSLKNLEKQLDLPDIVRCHRSFIVNLRRVRRVHGNARHYTLSLESYDQPIPVSRESEKRVLQILKNLNAVEGALRSLPRKKDVKTFA